MTCLLVHWTWTLYCIQCGLCFFFIDRNLHLFFFFCFLFDSHSISPSLNRIDNKNYYVIHFRQTRQNCWFFFCLFVFFAYACIVYAETQNFLLCFFELHNFYFHSFFFFFLCCDSVVVSKRILCKRKKEFHRWWYVTDAVTAVAVEYYAAYFFVPHEIHIFFFFFLHFFHILLFTNCKANDFVSIRFIFFLFFSSYYSRKKSRSTRPKIILCPIA